METVAFSPDGTSILVSRDDGAVLVDLEVGGLVGTSIRQEDVVTSVAFSPGEIAKSKVQMILLPHASSRHQSRCTLTIPSRVVQQGILKMSSASSRNYATAQEVFTVLHTALTADSSDSAYVHDRTISDGLAIVENELRNSPAKMTEVLTPALLSVLNKLSECIETEQDILESDESTVQQHIRGLEASKKKDGDEFDRTIRHFEKDSRSALQNVKKRLIALYPELMDEARKFKEQQSFLWKKPLCSLRNWNPKKLKKAMESFQQEQVDKIHSGRSTVFDEALRDLLEEWARMVQRYGHFINSEKETSQTHSPFTAFRDPDSEESDINWILGGAGMGAAVGAGAVAAGAATTTVSTPWIFGLFVTTATQFSIGAAIGMVAAPLVAGGAAVKVGIDAKKRRPSFEEFDKYIQSLDYSFEADAPAHAFLETLKKCSDGCVSDLHNEKERQRKSIEAEIKRKRVVQQTGQLSSEAMKLKVLVADLLKKLNRVEATHETSPV